MTSRERFEAWITAPPHNKYITRYSQNSPHWKGTYFYYDVQIAWEAWQAALERLTAERDALKALLRVAYASPLDGLNRERIAAALAAKEGVMFFDCAKCGGSFGPEHRWCPRCDQAMVEHTEALMASTADKARIAELEAKLERERMRLAACGVVALANTPESAKQARQMHADYRSGSCDDVARSVDAYMALRDLFAETKEKLADALIERDTLKAELVRVKNSDEHNFQRWQTVLKELNALKALLRDVLHEYSTQAHLFTTVRRIEAALAAKGEKP